MGNTIATLVLLIGSAANAASPTAQSVEHLLELTKAESMMDSMSANMEQVMRQYMQQAAAQRKLTEEQQRMLDRLPAKFAQAMREEFNWSTMKPSYIRVYQDTFQQEEIDGLIAFYESSVAQSMITKMPAAMQRSMAIT